MARSSRPYQVLPPDPKAPKLLPPDQVAAMTPQEQDEMRRRAAQWRAENDLQRSRDVGKPMILREPGAALRGAGQGLLPENNRATQVAASLTPLGLLPIGPNGSRPAANVVGGMAGEAGKLYGEVSRFAGNAITDARVAAASTPEEAALIQARREAAMAKNEQARAAELQGVRSELATLQGSPAVSTPSDQPAAAPSAPPDLPDQINSAREIEAKLGQMQRLLRSPDLSPDQKREIQVQMDGLIGNLRDIRAGQPRQVGVPSPSLLSPESIALAQREGAAAEAAQADTSVAARYQQARDFGDRFAREAAARRMGISDAQYGGLDSLRGPNTPGLIESNAAAAADRFRADEMAKLKPELDAKYAAAPAASGLQPSDQGVRSALDQARAEELRNSPVAQQNRDASAALAEGEAVARERRVAQAIAEQKRQAQQAERLQTAQAEAQIRVQQGAGTTPGVAGATLDSALAGAGAIAGQIGASKLSKIPAEAAGQFGVQVRYLSAAADQLAMMAPDEQRQAALDLLTGLGIDAAGLSAKIAANSKLDDQSRALYEQALEVVSRITEMAG